MSLFEEKRRAFTVINIRFVGWVSGTEKNRLLCLIDLSGRSQRFRKFRHDCSEGSLASREIPVIASTASPWQDLKLLSVCWWVNNDVDSLTIAVRKALSHG